MPDTVLTQGGEPPNPLRLPPVRAPRPIILLLVAGVLLVVVGVTAAGLVLLTSAHVTTNVLNQAVAGDGELVRRFVTDHVTPDDLAGGPLTPLRRLALQPALDQMLAPGAIVHAELVLPNGAVLLSDGDGGSAPQLGSPDWTVATSGRAVAAFVDADESGDIGPALPDALLREFFPVVRDGRVEAVVALWRDAHVTVAALADARRDILVVTLSSAACVALIMWLVFRSAQGRLTRQTIALLEAGRRDPLTGLLNHGAVVDATAAAIERLRSEGGGLAVAFIDIDNLGNLNEARGHETGDQAIGVVARLLERHVGDGLIGRYGPDEFMVTVQGPAMGTFADTLDGIRTALADVEMHVGAGERLPVTVSIGAGTYPNHGSSVTELLANVGLMLHEAQASGGDAIRWAGEDTTKDPPARTFDILQGLVFAVDAKDRYTKRHSEDVARYALFLAEALDLPAGTRQSLRTAALLHDIGKIGVPDRILRKPGRLDEAEYAAMQQHVLLGDAIVRELPDLQSIRAAIRHHHERWDGAGYLDGLAGDEIPFLARIIAVSDSFSAMTTDRPYRKAFSVDEAIRRLGDAAGSQLDERLVLAFIQAIEHHPHPPLPGGAGLVRDAERRPEVVRVA